MRNSMQHICALIPTYNNGKTIIDVVQRVHQHLRDIIVVDDGCTDDTLAQLKALDFPVTIVTHSRNKGKGAALASGFKKAQELHFDYALTIDADGQHYPEDIPLLLKALDIHPGAIIVGSRQFTDANMSGQSKFANRFSNFWFRIQTTINLPDTQTGMRIYPLNRLYGLRLMTNRYEAELELLVFAAWRNVPLVPVPIRVYYPPKGERVSHFRPAKDFTRISILNCFLCLGALLFGYINMYWRTILCFAVFGLSMLFIISPWSLLYFLIHTNTPQTRANYHRIIHRIAGLYCRGLIGMHYHIHNPYNIDVDKQPVVFISNHQSFLDVMLFLALSPKVVVMVKDYVWKNPIFAVVVRKLDCFPMTMDEEAKERLLKRVSEEGYSVVLFPEGTRSKDGEVGRFHRGAVHMAQQFNIPIQPILIEGMIDYMSRKQFALKPSQVDITILPPLAANDTSFGPNYKRQTKSLECHYAALLHANKPAVAILGAGVGGLFCGALLAEKGYIVTIFEQLPVFGGGMYSYERDGETWYTGMHFLSGLGEQGPVTAILNELDIRPDIVPTVLDNKADTLIGEAEWEETHNQLYRFVGGSQKLADQLAVYITRHGGRILLSQRVGQLTMESERLVVKTTDYTVHFDAVISSLHPKQLLALSQIPVYRPATIKRIMASDETAGSFKTYIPLEPNTIRYDAMTHYMPEHQLLIMTPCTESGQTYARTIETVMPLNYDQLKDDWKKDRKAHYAEYEQFKQQKEKDVIKLIDSVYPGVSKHIRAVFSSTSLTYRDDYLSPEGAMFGMKESVGSVRTRVRGLYVTGQNIFLHGLCGVAMTAKQTVQALCDDFN